MTDTTGIFRSGELLLPTAAPEAGVAVAATGADAMAAVQDNVKFSLADEDAALDSVPHDGDTAKGFADRLIAKIEGQL